MPASKFEPELLFSDPNRSDIKHSKRQECNSTNRCLTAKGTYSLIAFDFRKQSTHFANEQPPTLWGFCCLEAQEGLFKLPQKFEYFVLSQAPRRHLFFDAGKSHFE